MHFWVCYTHKFIITIWGNQCPSLCKLLVHLVFIYFLLLFLQNSMNAYHCKHIFSAQYSIFSVFSMAHTSWLEVIHVHDLTLYLLNNYPLSFRVGKVMNGDNMTEQGGNNIWRDRRTKPSNYQSLIKYAGVIL